MHVAFCFLKSHGPHGFVGAASADFAKSLPNMRRFEIYDVVMSASRRGLQSVPMEDPPFDHVVKFVFDDLEPMMACWQALGGAAGSPAPAFLGSAARLVIPVESLPQRDSAIGIDTRRLFVPIHRVAGRSLASFRSHWRGHAALIIENVPGLLGYFQNQTVDAAYAQGVMAWDGVAEFWFDSMDAVLALEETHPENMAAIAADELQFLGDTPIGNYIARPAQTSARAS
jgi:hypothetical protein